MLIKQKLLANTAILVISMFFMLALITYAISSLEAGNERNMQIAEVEVLTLQLRRDEKDFLARKTTKYADKFKKNYSRLEWLLNELVRSFKQSGSGLNEIKSVQSALREYQQHFLAIARLQKKIGLNPKDGLYGELRNAVHGVEELIGSNDNLLLSNMLQLRRNEKDFMLRLNEKYIERWQENSAIFVRNVEGSGLDASLIDGIKQNIAAYQVAFNNLADAQKTLGFTANQGLKGQMRAAVHKVDNMLATLVKQSNKRVNSDVRFSEMSSFIVFLIVLAIAITFALYVGKSILNAINQLKETMNKVAETKDLSITCLAESNDEIAEMATVFNNMIASFKSLIVEVNHSVDTVDDATQSLAQNISAANAGVDSQIQQTDLVATAVTEMVATVDEIANNTHEAANKAEATHHNAEKGKSGVDSTIAQIDQLSEKLLESENVVQELAKDSDTIGSVLDVIRGIAEQTNLLALNAAIEAARAGEQGRGFAVVADEVRTLASRTQDSTQEIETIISSLQSRTKEIVAHMATCRTQGQESAEQASSAGQMLEEITGDVSAIMEMSTAIATAIKEQSTVASEVNQHVVMIRDVAEQSGQAARQNEQMSEELSQQAKVLNQEVNSFTV